MQCLRDNSGRFKKDKTITNLTLVRNREKVTEQLIKEPNDINNGEIKENDNKPGRENHDTMEENEQISQEETEVMEEDEDLRELFQAQMERAMKRTKDDIEKRERLMKVKLSEEIKQSVNNIIANHLGDKNSLPEISETEYAIARAVEIKLEIKRPLRKERKRKKIVESGKRKKTNKRAERAGSKSRK